MNLTDKTAIIRRLLEGNQTGPVCKLFIRMLYLRQTRTQYTMLLVSFSMLTASALPLDGGKLLLMSLDGFRWDYLQIASNYGVKTPHFDFLLHAGAQAIVRPCYITITFPSHMSIISGLYSESHGVLAHIMDDPHLGHFKGYKKPAPLESDQVLDPNWMDVGAEPIWVTNQKHSVKHKSGVYFWPGCGTKFKGHLPSIYERFDKKLTPFEERITTAVRWFVEKDINLGIVYIDEPDTTGHQYGPDSKEIAAMVGKLDTLLGQLIDQLKENHLFEKVNIIITSDHGMTPAIDPATKVVELDKYLSRDMYKSNFLWPVRPIWPKPGMEDKVMNSLKKIPYLTVYNKSSMPEEYHFRDHPRIGPIQVESDPGVMLVYSLKEYLNNTKGHFHKGVHGYTNRHRDMLNIFIAHGPMFRQGYKSDVIFPNVDIYPLMCHILGIEPAPNNGTLQHVKHLLKLHQRTRLMMSDNGFFVWFVLSVVFILWCLLLSCRGRQGRNCDICEGVQVCPTGRFKLFLACTCGLIYVLYTIAFFQPSFLKT